MALKLAAAENSLMDVLDRVLDKGIVIDAWMRVSLVGLDLLHVEARIVRLHKDLPHACTLSRKKDRIALAFDRAINSQN